MQKGQGSRGDRELGVAWRGVVGVAREKDRKNLEVEIVHDVPPFPLTF